MAEVKEPTWDETTQVETAPSWDETTGADEVQKKSSVDISSDGIPLISSDESVSAAPSTSPKQQPITESLKMSTKKNFLENPIYSNPKNRDVYYNTLSSKGYDKDAIKHYGETLTALKPFLPTIMKRVNDNPNDTEALYQLGRAQLALGETLSAVSTFSNLIAKQPTQPANYQGLAYAMKLSGDNKSAEELTAKAIELTPTPEPGNVLSEALNAPAQQQDQQGFPIAQDNSGQSFPTAASENLNQIASGMEQLNPALSSGKGMIGSLEDATKAVSELPAAMREDGFNGFGAIPTSTFLKAGEIAMHGAFGVAQASPAGILFNSSVSAVTMAGGEKPLEYIMQPATKIADALGYVPKSEAGKSTLAILNAVGSIAMIEAPHIAIKMKSGHALTEADVHEIKSIVENNPEKFKEALKDEVIKSEPAETQKLKEKQIGLQDDLNKNLPVLGDDAKKLFQPEIDKLQEKIDAKKEETTQQHVDAAQTNAVGSQIDDEITTLNGVKENTDSPEGKKIVDEKIKQLTGMKPEGATVPTSEPQPEMPVADVKGEKILSADEWNRLSDENQEKLKSTLTAKVTDVNGKTFSVDHNLAKPLQKIIDAGYKTGQSDSGTVSDHPNYRYVEDDKNGNYKKGDVIEAGGGAYLTFWKPEANVVEKAGSEINTQEQIDVIRKAAKASGFIVEDTEVFSQPSLRLSLPFNDKGISRAEVLEEANKRTNKKYPGLRDKDFLSWLDKRNHEFEPEVVKEYGKKSWTDKEVIDKWNILADRLSELKEQSKTQSDAVQEPSTSSVLQHPPEATPEAGSERGRVEPVKQGTEASTARAGSDSEGAPKKETVKLPEDKFRDKMQEIIHDKLEKLESSTPAADVYRDKLLQLKHKPEATTNSIEVGDYIRVAGTEKKSGIEGFVKSVARKNIKIETTYGGWADSDVIMQEHTIAKSEVTALHKIAKNKSESVRYFQEQAVRKIKHAKQRTEKKSHSKSQPGKQIEPHKEVKTDLKTVADELKLSDADLIIYNELHDVAPEERMGHFERMIDQQDKRMDEIDDKISKSIDDRRDDIDREIDAVNESDTIGKAKKKTALQKLNKEYESLAEEHKRLEAEREKVVDAKEELEDYYYSGDEGNIDGVNSIIDRVNARLDTRISVREGTDMFPENANIKELKQLTDESTIFSFEKRTADQIEKSEPAIKDIESKADNAESLSEEDLRTGIDQADKLLNDSRTDQVGFGGSPKIETHFWPKNTEPVKASDIIKKLSEKLGVPIRTGNVRWGRRLGIFKVREEVVRVKEGNDLAVASHEIAHYIDKKFKPNLRDKSYNLELKDLDYDQKKRRNFEGFAEFVRYYLTGDDAAQRAPRFHNYFENVFLKSHPEIEKIIKEAKTEITKWREQGAESRMISEIDWDGSGKRDISFAERMRQARSRWIDALGALKYAMNEMLGDKVKDVRPADNPYQLAQAGNKAAAAKARAFVMEGITDFTGEKTFKSLKEIVAPVTKDIKSALAYTRALRIKFRAGKNGDVNPNVLEDAHTIVDKYKDNEAYNTFAKEVTQWNGHLLEYLADAGRITEEVKTRILDSDLIYIPFKHAFERGESQPTGASKVLFNLGVPLKRFNKKGGDIVNPLEVMMQNAEKIIATADKNRVVNALIDIAEDNQGLGKWVEKVAPPQSATTTGIAKLKNQLEGLGADLSEADMDGVLTLFSQAPGYFGKDNIGVVYRNGKPEFYEFHPELFRALKGMDNANIAWFTNTLLGQAVTGVTKMTRLGATGLRAGFQLISNPIRDMWTATLQTQFHSPMQPFRAVKGILDALGNSESHRMFKALGGETAQPLGLDRKYTQNLVREILADDAKSKAMNVVKSPIEMIRKVLSFPEAGVRMGEFESVVKKYQERIDAALQNGDMAEVKKLKQDRAVEAANAANEVTVNFKRMGGYTTVLNQIIFGFNPTIQGLSKMGRSIADHPMRSLMRGAAYLTAPTLALWALNKDEEWYQQLKPWERYAFWHFKVGDTIFKLPKPFEWGYVFGGIPEGVANTLYQDDNYYMKTATKEAALQLMPSMLPDAIKAPAELYFNWDMFRNQPVIPTSQENLLPPLQYSPNTSSVAKELGEILNVAPIKIDHLLNGYTGGLAGDILNGLPKEYKEKADIPVVGRLFLRQGDALLNGDYVQRFYDLADQALKVNTSVKAYPKMKENATMEEMKKTLRLGDEQVRLFASFDQINQIKKSLTELRNAQKKIQALKVDHELKERAMQEIGHAAIQLVTPIVEGGKK